MSHAEPSSNVGSPVYGAEEGEVKGHVGVKRSGRISSCAPLLG